MGENETFQEDEVRKTSGEGEVFRGRVNNLPR